MLGKLFSAITNPEKPQYVCPDCNSRYGSDRPILRCPNCGSARVKAEKMWIDHSGPLEVDHLGPLEIDHLGPLESDHEGHLEGNDFP